MIQPKEEPLAKLRTEAHALRYGYAVNVFSINQIEKWAERWIATLETPSIELIELATIRCAYPIDVLNMLQTVSDEMSDTDCIEVSLGISGALFQQEKLTLREAIDTVWSLHSEPGITQYQEGMIYYLDDAYDLAIQGSYGSLEQTEADFREFVRPYVAALPISVHEIIGQG